jgi:hypothetical protein
MSDIEFFDEPLAPPKKPSPDDPVAWWRWMEDLTTYHQIQAIQAAPRHPRKPPYVPRYDEPDVEAPPIAPAE